MKDDRVNMVFYTPKNTMSVIPDRWQFKPSGKWAWLQKKAWKFLFKTKALENSYEETTEYRKVNFRKSDFGARLVQKYKHQLDQIGARPRRVYMGPNEFDSLLADKNRDYVQTQPSSFSFDIPLGYDYTVLGLKITVIPWMTGVLIVD